MPIYIPDRIKAPGDFPTLDANDNQIRGFGFFDDATERSALKSNLRCQGYLAFMKDTTQFKQYDSASEADVDWENDSNWVLIEGQQTDTYWALDSIGGSAIYYSNPVWIGSSLYAGSEQLYVNGDTKISGALEATTSVKTPIVQSDTSLVIGIDAPNGGVPPSLILEWKYGINRFFSASPYKSPAPDFVFGNQLKNWDFKFQTISANADVVHDVPSGVNPGFQFKGSVDSVDVSGKFVANLTDGSPRFSFENDLRKIIFAPEGYKISTTVDADANVLNGVEILLPDPDTGDMHFKNIAQKNFLFSTNTGSGSPTEILEMKPDLVVSNVNLEVNGSGNFLGNINVGVADSALTGIYLRRTDNALMGGIRTNDNNTVIIGGFNNDRVQIARHVADGTLDDEVMGHFNTTGLGLGTTSPSQKLHVVGSMYLLDNTTDNNTLIGTGWPTLTGQFNTALGGGALSNVTATNFTVAIGYEAGKNSGSNSVAIGYRASSNTDDVVIGHESGNGAGGNSNVIVGRRAGQKVGGGSVLIGHEAGRYAFGSNNTVLGYQAFVGVDGVSDAINTVAIGRWALKDLTTGDANTAVGHNALYSITTGSQNVAVGTAAGQNITDNRIANTLVGFSAGENASGGAGYNTLIGHYAGRNMTSQQNVAVGPSAGYEAANNNVILGLRAGYSVGTANVVIGMDAGQGGAVAGQVDSSIAIGYEAARYTTGSNNTVVGYQAYKGVDGVSDRSNITAIGYQALLSLTTGVGNTAVGHESLQNTTTKNYNTAVGALALRDMDETGSNGQYVTAVGFEAGQYLVAQQSTLVGFRAGKSATGAITVVGYNAAIAANGGTYFGYGTASGSTVRAIAIGQENYRNVTSGGNDIVIGDGAMYSSAANKNTGSNVIVGNGASYFAGTDTYNTVIGHSALRGHTQGADAGYLNRDYNVAIGDRAMYRAYSGANNNIVIGYQAGYSQQLATDAGDLSTVTFANNVFIGYQSAYDITSGNRNVAIGEQSAFELTEGENNVILGYKAGLNLTTGDANVLLGYGAGGQLTTESNKLYIANSNTTTPLIYGDFSLGNVGIGETSPDTKLHITGSQVNSKLLTIENIADANWGGGLILKWANADGTNPYSVDIGAYNISGQQMRFKFTGLSERVSFSGAPGYQFDKEVIPGSGAADGGIASQYHSHLYFRLRSNNGNNGHDPTNMYFKAEGGTGTSNISGNLMIMKGDGDIEVPNGDLEISDSSNGLILKDTVTSTRYRVQITSGAIAISAV